jgi:hypothetical protein
MRRRGKALGALFGIGFCLALIAPQAGLAAVRCQQGPEPGVLSISVTAETYVSLRRVGDAIKVFDAIDGGSKCKLSATVTNTDRIELSVTQVSAAYVELVGGPFAPGATADEDAAAEIEFEASGPGYVEVIGGRGPDHFRYMDSGSESGVNLNPEEDEDLDVVVSRESRVEMLFIAGGGDGPDRIDALGAPALEMFAIGGKGGDTLVAPPVGAILDGGRGPDRLIGSRAFDLIVPGRGADRVTARGSSDLIEVNRDGSRDRINCGSGRDVASKTDRLDRLGSCEVGRLS